MQARKDIEKENTILILNNIDYLIDGRYEKEKKTKTLDFRGSINQRCWKRISDYFVDCSKTYFKENFI